MTWGRELKMVDVLTKVGSASRGKSELGSSREAKVGLSRVEGLSQ